MSVIYSPQANSSIMSIDAITSPCHSNKNNTHKSRQSSVSSASSGMSDSQQLPFVDDGFKRITGSPLIASTNSTSASPSFSSLSGSDPESDFYSGHSFAQQHFDNNLWFQPIFRHSRVQTNGSTFTDRSEDQLSAFSILEGNKVQKTDRLLSLGENLNYTYSENSSTIRSQSKKGDALATRRARNKLASAKYRAKKQALTHAMQDRIMQLATQVMTLRDELSQTRKNEMEIKIKYERLLQYHQHDNSMMFNENTTIKPLY